MCHSKRILVVSLDSSATFVPCYVSYVCHTKRVLFIIPDIYYQISQDITLYFRPKHSSVILEEFQCSILQTQTLQCHTGRVLVLYTTDPNTHVSYWKGSGALYYRPKHSCVILEGFWCSILQSQTLMCHTGRVLVLYTTYPNTPVSYWKSSSALYYRPKHSSVIREGFWCSILHTQILQCHTGRVLVLYTAHPNTHVSQYKALMLYNTNLLTINVTI